MKKKGGWGALKPETNCLSYFSTVVLLRESGEVNVKLYSLRTEFFVSFLSENFSRKISYFYAAASCSLYILKLSQLIKLPPNDILTKMLLLSLLYRNYDIICKYVPKTKKWLDQVDIEDHIYVFPK